LISLRTTVVHINILMICHILHKKTYHEWSHMKEKWIVFYEESLTNKKQILNLCTTVCSYRILITIFKRTDLHTERVKKMKLQSSQLLLGLEEVTLSKPDMRYLTSDFSLKVLY
jgi:hypothetical protein